jgi:hypothetical protein
MIGDSKTYSVQEESFLKWVPYGFWVGSTFIDSGRRMEITAVGKAYVKDDQRFIDIETKEIESVPTAAEENKCGGNA